MSEQTKIPADGSATNDVAWQLGLLAHESGVEHVGDPIDRGLRLLRLLSENGFEIHWKAGRQPKASPDVR